MNDKRRYERYDCSLTGDFELPNNVTGLLNCLNISMGGAGIVTAKPLPLSSSIKINCLTKMNSLFSTIGKVSWCAKKHNGWETGIMFEKPLSMPLEILL